MAKDITKFPVTRRAAIAAATRALPARPDADTRDTIPVTAAQRQIMICEAAYYIAEHRGFEPGHDVDDWLVAEQQIDAALTSLTPRGAGARLQR